MSEMIAVNTVVDTMEAWVEEQKGMTDRFVHEKMMAEDVTMRMVSE